MFLRARNENEVTSEDSIIESHQQAAIDENSVVHHQYDNLGMILVTVTFNGNNYLLWSRSIQRALTAKEKIDYILKDDLMPEIGSPEYQQWHRTDCMVTTWILNSMTKEFAEAFLFATNARSLWLELEDRFGGNNGPRLFQIKREISLLTQGNDSVMLYFTHLKKLWNELDLLRIYPSCHCRATKNCICNVSKRIAILNEEDKLIQFLMGLNESYENVKSHILLMDPFPSVNKAYGMIQRVEKHKEVSINPSIKIARKSNYRAKTGSKKFDYKYQNKEYMKCNFCDSNGHTRDTCFKLIGYPEWHPKRKKKSNRNSQLHMAHSNNVSSGDENNDTDQEYECSEKNVSQMISEVYKMMKGKASLETPIPHTPSKQFMTKDNDFSAFAGLSGPNNSTYGGSGLEE